MAFYNRDYLLEVYKSKYSEYLDDNEEDDEDEDDKKENSSSEEKKLTPSHLSKPEIRHIVTIVTFTLQDFKKLKKCCDYVDLGDHDHINDEGERESSYGKYYNEDPKAFIELINGDVLSGYPDFRTNGSAEFNKDEKEFIKSVNKLFEEKGIKAKFMSGPGKDDEVISFGVKSTKEK